MVAPYSVEENIYKLAKEELDTRNLKALLRSLKTALDNFAGSEY